MSTKSLLSVVPPDVLVTNSEHLETHLVAVPKSNVKDFIRSYETLAPMVVPRSAHFVTSDDEFSLYAVTIFRKHGHEFVHKCREKKWVPRDFKYKQGGKEEEEQEVKRVEAEEKRVWGETLRLGRTGWSEGVMCLVHVVVLRVFVETVLRYGLPLDFVAVLVKVRFFRMGDAFAILTDPCVQTDSKREKKVKQGLDENYSYLAGNAFGRDKKGRVKKDEGMVSADLLAGAGDAAEYSAYVCYDIDVD